MEGLAQFDGGAATLRAHVRFPSKYLWDDDNGVTHTIPQGEGGEQGDAMMPLLFLLGSMGQLKQHTGI